MIDELVEQVKSFDIDEVGLFFFSQLPVRVDRRVMGAFGSLSMPRPAAAVAQVVPVSLPTILANGPTRFVTRTSWLHLPFNTLNHS